MESVHKPCVLLKYTTNRAENHPHQLDEMPVGPGETDAGRMEKKTKKCFWRWLFGPDETGGQIKEAKIEEKRMSGSGPLSTFFATELQNMTWLRLRKSSSVWQEHIRDMAMVQSYKCVMMIQVEMEMDDCSFTETYVLFIFITKNHYPISRLLLSSSHQVF